VRMPYTSLTLTVFSTSACFARLWIGYEPEDRKSIQTSGSQQLHLFSQKSWFALRWDGN
jgi:hypothetical protein